MQTCDPLQARAWFALREPLNWVINIVVMAFLFFVLMQFLPALAAFLIALAAVFCLYFFVLFQRPFGIVCPHCKGLIETDTPWRCAYCGKENFDTNSNPFVGRCANHGCRAKPKAYECHHCRKPIFFTKDRQVAGMATCVVVPAKTGPKRVKKDKHTEQVDALQKSIQLKKLQKEAGSLDVEIKNTNQMLAGPKMKSVEELYRAELKNEDDERRLRSAIDTEFKNDEAERKRRHLVVDKIMRDVI